MMEAVHRHGGYIVQSTGDGIFALFGAPVAHEDHPQRALYAGLRMQEDLKRDSDTLRVRGQAPVSMRVGVNTGEVVVRTLQTGATHTEYTPIGHSTGLAARLQTLRRARSPSATRCAAVPVLAPGSGRGPAGPDGRAAAAPAHIGGHQAPGAARIGEPAAAGAG